MEKKFYIDVGSIKMRNVIAMVLIVAMAAAICGCSNPGGPGGTDPTEGPGTTVPVGSTNPSEPIGTSEPVAHVHSYSSESIPSSCEQDGYTLYTCECGDSYKSGIVPSAGHEYGEWVVVQAATYDAEGLREQTCIVCGDKITESIPKVEEHTHAYVDTLIAPTCSVQGYTAHICSICGEHYEDSYVDALGHEYGDWVVVQESTTDSEGLKERSCARCGEKESEVIPKVKDHEHSYSSKVVDATCEKDGYTVYSCECGHTYQDSVVSATGHNWSEWKVTKEPTTAEAGSKSRTCKYCGGSESEEIPKHEHAYTESTVAPTCEEYGYTVYTCACGKKYETVVADALGHLWSEWEVTVDPTTSSTGERSRSCSRCKEIVTESVPALDPDTGEAYESYIDPRITVKKNRSSIAYRYADFSVTDYRSWGDPPSIWINEDGTWTVVYFQQDGTRVEFVIDFPPEGYISDCVIKDDGSYKVTLTGSYGG